MKQILQNLGTGETLLAEVPCPRCAAGSLLIETACSLVSLGTEKMLIDFGRGSLLEKARSQPDKVKQVLQKVRADGLVAAVEAVRAKLDQPVALGYCNVGRVAGGAGMSGVVEEEGTADAAEKSDERGRSSLPFPVGTRVVSNGPHAEVVAVPRNLVARVPDGVSDEAAAFTVVGAIGLQGIRLLAPTLGERVVVSGLGLIGLLCVQMLRAHGCRVLGVDFDARKLALARGFGAEVVDLAAGEDPVAAAEAWTGGAGVDGVLITASTKSDEVVHQAATMCRKRGRIVLVGVVGLNLRRDDFYKKELSFQVSCSYGPGRYDPAYEGTGYDYPPAYVRWTEQRNFEAVLGLMAEGKLDVGPLVSHRFPFERALEAYEVVGSGNALGIVLEYPVGRTGLGPPTCPLQAADADAAGGHGRPGRSALPGPKYARVVPVGPQPATNNPQPTTCNLQPPAGPPVLGFIGAGNFTVRKLLPLVRKSGARLKTIVSSTGVSGTHAARKFGFEQSASDAAAVLGDPEVDAVFITTPHNSHARFACQALAAGKHVFVEKPLCLTLDELADIAALRALPVPLSTVGTTGPGRPICPPQAAPTDAAESHGPAGAPAPVMESRPAGADESCLMVGFNRRFSPHTVWMKDKLAGVPGPKAVVITVNAGAIPADHWTQDPAVGGGRIVGEACHFIDLARHLVAHPITDCGARFLGGHDGRLGDCATIELAFGDGSIASIHYLANGHKGFPKERMEVFAGGRVLVCDNFRRTRGHGVRGGVRTRRQDKGHARCVQAFLAAVRGDGPAPIPVEELLEVSEATLRVAGRC